MVSMGYTAAALTLPPVLLLKWHNPKCTAPTALLFACTPLPLGTWSNAHISCVAAYIGIGQGSRK